MTRRKGNKVIFTCGKNFFFSILGLHVQISIKSEHIHSLYVHFCSTKLTWDRQEDREERKTIQDSDIYHLHIHQYSQSASFHLSAHKLLLLYIPPPAVGCIHTRGQMIHQSIAMIQTQYSQTMQTDIIKYFIFIYCIFIFYNLKIFMCSLYDKE